MYKISKYYIYTIQKLEQIGKNEKKKKQDTQIFKRHINM